MMKVSYMIKLFNIFKKNKSISPKELYKPVLSNMWMCLVNFTSYDMSRYDYIIEEVGIKKAEVDEGSIWVESDFKNPYDRSDHDIVRGYIDKFSINSGYWTGFFETKEIAISNYNKLANRWIEIIKNKLIN